VALTGKDIGARGYVDLTLDCMRAFGAQVEAVDDTTWRVAPTATTGRTGARHGSPSQSAHG